VGEIDDFERKTRPKERLRFLHLHPPNLAMRWWKLAIHQDAQAISCHH